MDEKMIKGNIFITAGILILILGISLIFIGSIIQSTSSNNTKDNSSKTEIKTGGVIMIGPIPIIFGSDKGMMITGVILAIILMIVSYFLFYRGIN
jgi:uncharacterized protein (TIGR00304 family)